MSAKKTITSGSDGFQRMNFLYQASIVALNAAPHCPLITSLFGTNMISIGKKLQLKLDPSLKRTICKGCKGLLIPGKSAEVKIKKISFFRKKKSKLQKPRKTQEWKCMICSCVKCFLLKPGYQLWSEQKISCVLYILQNWYSEIIAGYYFPFLIMKLLMFSFCFFIACIEVIVGYYCLVITNLIPSFGNAQE